MQNLVDIKAVVFDMDGLLLDSERVALATFVESCRVNGFQPDVTVYYQCIGSNEARTSQILQAAYGSGFPFEQVNTLWHALYEHEANLHPFPLKSGAAELLSLLEFRNISCACATSTRRLSAERKLANAGIFKFFKHIIGGDEITKCKPDPEIYLKACERLHCHPEHCLALEDSENGVLAAYYAGMQVIQVPDLVVPSDQVRALGHRIVNSLLEVRDLL